MKNNKVKIYDTTLREGMQMVGTSFSLGDKVQIAMLLDSLGVSFIEGGFPGGSPKDMAFYSHMKNITLKNSKLVAFGPTVKFGSEPENDTLMKALVDAGTEYVTIFGKCNEKQVKDVLNVTLDENLAMIKSSVSYLVSLGKKVFFDAEHFFSGVGINEKYAFDCLAVAKDAGASCLVLCDTNGGMMPGDIEIIVNKAVDKFSKDCEIGVHLHNDSGFADYSTILSVQNGVTIPQMTLNGWGERCGNANLFTVVPNLQLKLGIDCSCNVAEFYESAHRAAEIANIKISESTPYVGKNAFSHKAGVHIDAVCKNTTSYEHIEPEAVGNVRRFMLSEQSGKAAVLAKVNKLLPTLGVDKDKASYIADKIKDLEMKGYTFENADASFEMLVRKIMGIRKEWFKLNNYKVVTINGGPDSKESASAIVDVTVDGTEEVTAANGIGPVDALDSALRKALNRFYPKIASIRLVDYKVRVLESKQATASVVRVVVESSDGNSTWCTLGVSSDIIEASFKALVDSLEYKLEKDY